MLSRTYFHFVETFSCVIPQNIVSRAILTFLDFSPFLNFYFLTSILQSFFRDTHCAKIPLFVQKLNSFSESKITKKRLFRWLIIYRLGWVEFWKLVFWQKLEFWNSVWNGVKKGKEHLQSCRLFFSRVLIMIGKKVLDPLTSRKKCWLHDAFSGF